jgi:hypothetical protein
MAMAQRPAPGGAGLEEFPPDNHQLVNGVCRAPPQVRHFFDKKSPRNHSADRNLEALEGVSAVPLTMIKIGLIATISFERPSQ